MGTNSRIWSPQQLAIFTWFAAAMGNLVVRARAGTGKTTTILEAIRHIPGDVRILFCAFNKRIQLELAAKLADPRAEAKTLHALGFYFIRQAWKSVKIDASVEDDRIVAVVGHNTFIPFPPIRKLIGLAKGMVPFGTVAEVVELAYAFECEADNGAAADWSVERIAEVAHAAMQLAKVKDPRGRISYDDMLYIPLACNMVRPMYDWVLVDEQQDMNAAQLLIAQRACRKNGHLVGIGDDMQAIYAFRGADSGSIDRIKSELAADELGLTITYRCPKSVVALAQTLVPDYQAAPSAPEGFVATLPEASLPQWVGVGDAILSRTNAPLVSLCLGLLRAGTPARIEGRDIGKMLVNLVRKFKAKSIPDFLVRLRGWGDKQRARITAHGKDVDARCQNIDDQVETLAALADGCESVTALQQRCENMFSDTIGPDGKVDRSACVVLSSVHKAKGLEWKKVFILANTLYCGGRRTNQEERNIAYVAYTRSQESLVLAV